jgi:hypothetical protein
VGLPVSGLGTITAPTLQVWRDVVQHRGGLDDVDFGRNMLAESVRAGEDFLLAERLGGWNGGERGDGNGVRGIVCRGVPDELRGDPDRHGEPELRVRDLERAGPAPGEAPATIDAVFRCKADDN